MQTIFELIDLLTIPYCVTVILKLLGIWCAIATLLSLLIGRGIALGHSAEVLYCPQCCEDSTIEELHANEGYCLTCCRENQDRLDQHNAEYDRWERLTGPQREAEIRRSV